MLARRLLIPALLLGASTLAAHDLFLKLADYRVAPNAPVRITALNGTFTTSENSLARARVAELTLVGPDAREQLDTTHLTAVGTRTIIRARTGPAGTYLLGLSIRPSEITLAGAQFNQYLEEEGLSRVLEDRRTAGELTRGATERYAKHVKVLFQAGTATTENFSTVLGFPAEIVPVRNPYELSPGDTLRARLLVDGKPARDLEALAGGRSTGGRAFPVQRLRADTAGMVSVVLRSPGTWYVKFIAMTRVHEPKLDYVSHWATVTFAIHRPKKATP